MQSCKVCGACAKSARYVFSGKYLQWKPRYSWKGTELPMKTALMINRLQPNLHRLQRMREECEIRNVTKGWDAAEKAHFSPSSTLNYPMNATKPISFVAHARKRQSMNFLKKNSYGSRETDEKAECYPRKVPLIIDLSQSNLQAR